MSIGHIVNMKRNISKKLSHMISEGSIKLNKRMSIRNVDISLITRKEKQDLIDEKVIEFESNMEQIEETLNAI